MSNQQISKDELIANARARAFASPLMENFEIQIIQDENELWKFYNKEDFAYLPTDLFFNKKELTSANQWAKLQLLNAQPSLTDSLLIKDIKSGQTAALFHGWQKNLDSYYMQFTAVHRHFRRQGLYSALLDRIIEYTRLLGFNTLSSCHSPNNNPILISKLKKNFKITSLEIDSELGMNVWLTYFHNEHLAKAFEFRCGHVSFNHALFSSSEGTMDLLYETLTTAKEKNS